MASKIIPRSWCQWLLPARVSQKQRRRHNRTRWQRWTRPLQATNKPSRVQLLKFSSFDFNSARRLDQTIKPLVEFKLTSRSCLSSNLQPLQMNQMRLRKSPKIDCERRFWWAKYLWSLLQSELDLSHILLVEFITPLSKRRKYGTRLECIFFDWINGADGTKSDHRRHDEQVSGAPWSACVSVVAS